MPSRHCGHACGFKFLQVLPHNRHGHTKGGSWSDSGAELLDGAIFRGGNSSEPSGSIKNIYFVELLSGAISKSHNLL